MAPAIAEEAADDATPQLRISSLAEALQLSSEARVVTLATAP
jgi:hypothetical protein